MSTPPVLAKSTNTCSDYKRECVGPTQKALFYTSLVLLVVGISGHIVSLVAFMKAQRDDRNQDDATIEENQFQPVDAMFAYVKEIHRVERNYSFRIIILLLVPAVAVFFLPYVHPWLIRFGVPTICSLVATLTFVLFVNGGPELRDRDNVQSRCELKFVILMIPLLVTFLFCGVVTSLGNTYFVEQANNMSYKVGKIKVPITILLLVYDFSKGVFTKIYIRVVNYFQVGGLERYVPAYGIGMALILSSLCCITAAKIENRRIHVIINHGLLDKPDEKIPMSVFWLVFQFVLLAGHDSLAENSISGFLNKEPPDSMKKYMFYFTHAVNGLGTVGSVLLVFIIGKISKSVGHTSWFQDTLNKSRLEKYYWVLACLSALIFIWHTVFSCIYPYHTRNVN